MKHWEAVEVFVRVVEAGSFSAAAGQLAVSKSHASRQLSALEGRLGVQLLTRSTRRLTLTEVGEAYYLRCKSILTQMEETELAVMEQQAEPHGSLRVTVAGAFGERYVAPAAAEFLQRYPALNLHLDFNNRNVDLLEEGYDLAIRAGVLKDSSLIARRIAERRLVICGSRDYFDRCGVPNTLRDLRGHSCLVGSLPTWRFRDRDGQHSELKVEGRWRSNNGHALLAAARRGLGLVQLPEFYVYEDLQAGRLQAVMADYQPTDTAVWAVYPRNRYLSAKVSFFVDFLAERFRGIDYLSC
ncbi:LysR substrate-binding domain-containing protein [Spongiibacter sp.]|uniref:LysR substrate-binding domain-containing protein n=1 Tax=Spongiibacter sp. TaxID=2024860 RepID=UPI00356A9F84